MLIVKFCFGQLEIYDVNGLPSGDWYIFVDIMPEIEK